MRLFPRKAQESDLSSKYGGALGAGGTAENDDPLLSRVTIQATEGPMPETVETFNALRSSGETRVVVDLVNCSAVPDEDILGLIEEEIHSTAEECGVTVVAVFRSQ